jgi:BirA family transcriptional regulator, biotin operon repressor / biotin---[acetyl-CoA-carboxylase] ligase
MLKALFFEVLDTVDSTNNYAMAKIAAAKAKDGMAFFAKNQTDGKGQRGKQWQSQPRQNIILSVVFAADTLKLPQPYLFNMLMATTVQQFFTEYAIKNTTIKWPNDIYWCDRKAGGILIENNYTGKNWNWAVVGIGLNINQLEFNPLLPNPTSLQQITGNNYDVLLLAKQLHTQLVAAVQNIDVVSLLKNYNAVLYKKDKQVKLKKGNIVFETTIKHVDEKGILHCEDVMEREFEWGEVEWVG